MLQKMYKYGAQKYQFMILSVKMINCYQKAVINEIDLLSTFKPICKDNGLTTLSIA